MKPEGRPTKEKILKEYIKENPGATPAETAKDLGISRLTAYKYLK